MTSIDGTGPRFSTVTPDDHGGVVWTVSILCGIYTVLIATLRAYIKRNTWGGDDWLALAATFTSFAQYISVFVGTSDGLGKSYKQLSRSEVSSVGKSVLASEILFVISLALAKGSVVLLIRRLFSVTKSKRSVVLGSCLAFCGVWGLASILLIAVNCPILSRMGYQGDFCASFVARWDAIGILDAISEAAIFGIVVVLLWDLRMKKQRKMQILTAFCFRLLLIAFAIVHLWYQDKFTTRPNTGVRLANPITFQQIELCYSLLSATIPNLKSFLLNFDTAVGMTLDPMTLATYGQSHSQSHNGNASFRLRSLGSRFRGGDKSASQTGAQPSFRPDNVGYTAAVGQHPTARQPEAEVESAVSRDNISDRSKGSQEMIIRREVAWSVHQD